MSQGGGDATGQSRVLMIQQGRSELNDADGKISQLFKPLRVWIGPCHRDLFPEEKREIIEKEKQDVLDSFFTNRAQGQQRPDRQMVDKVQKALEKKASEAAKLYTPTPDISRKEQRTELATMLLHDGCYVLSFLVNCGNNKYNNRDPTEESKLLCDIMFLLENQIPWFVLKEIDDVTKNNNPGSRPANDLEEGRLRGLLQEGLFYISGSRRAMSTYEYGRRRGGPSHLLHLVHHYLKPTKVLEAEEEDALLLEGKVGPGPAEPRRCTGRWRRATEYMRYGFVELRRRDLKEHGVDSILDVSLVEAAAGATLWIPPLRIQDHTWTMLRNLMALEERDHRMTRKPVTAYCYFMSQLAGEVEDVALLQRKGILQNLLANDEELVEGFRGLCRNVVFDIDSPEANYLNGTWHDLQKRFQTSRYEWIGSFYDTYLGGPATSLAFLVAALVLIYKLAVPFLSALMKNKTNHPQCTPISRPTP
ncbi:unnamed protein product [Urochloa humidicola]